MALQLRRDTAANFVGVTLAAGEPAYETDTGRYKIGDGSTTYASLEFAALQEVVDDATPQLGGTLVGDGNQVEGYINKVVGTVTGALTTTAHSGNLLVTSGNVTVPTTAGFTCVLIAGGSHTVTFNATTSAAMAAGDIMTVFVESSTVIHAVLTAAADKVSFT